MDGNARYEAVEHSARIYEDAHQYAFTRAAQQCRGIHEFYPDDRPEFYTAAFLLAYYEVLVELDPDDEGAMQAFLEAHAEHARIFDLE